MKKVQKDRNSERGGAGVKLLMVGVVLVLIGHAGLKYVPVAYEGASLRQEMDTAVVKGLATIGQEKPLDVVKKSAGRLANEYQLPADSIVEVKQNGQAITARIAYSKSVPMLPFGLYDYTYSFDHTATPTGYLSK